MILIWWSVQPIRCQLDIPPKLWRNGYYVMNFVSKFWSNPGTIALLRLLVFRFLFFWFRFCFVFVLLSVDWNILLMSRFGHAQFSQPIRVLPDTMDQSESLISKPISIENPVRSAKLFKFKPETLNSAVRWFIHPNFESSHFRLRTSYPVELPVG